MVDATLSAALREAYAMADADDVVLDTIEIWHASFATPLRLVLDKSPLDAKLEANAPRDPGAVVTFAPYDFDIVPPEVDPDSTPSCTLEIDNVGRELGVAMDAALSAGGLVTVIYRSFMESTALVGPENGGLELTLESATLTADRFRARIGWPDLLNRTFPDGEYTLEEFPGLAEA